MKLQARDRAQLVIAAYEAGLAPVDEHAGTEGNRGLLTDRTASAVKASLPFSTCVDRKYLIVMPAPTGT
jgi:hypothetical protein